MKNKEAPLMWMARINHPLLIFREMLIILWKASSIKEI